MDDAGLDHRLRPGSGDCFGEAFQTVAADNQHVGDAPVSETAWASTSSSRTKHI